MLRDRATLLQLDQCLKQRPPAALPPMPANCLLPIAIDVIGRGAIEPFSIVCAPTKVDVRRQLRQQRRSFDSCCADAICSC